MAALVVIVIATSAGNKDGSTPSASSGAPVSTSQAAKAVSSAPSAQQTITYVVTGSGSADITYGPSGSSLTGNVPMHVTATLGDAAYYAIQAQLNGSGDITAEILVNGKVISEGSADGGYNIASAEITQDPLTNQWTDANQG